MPLLRRHLPALLTAIALSAFFMIVYGVCNDLAARRPHVGTWVYAWERNIPFVPIFVIPYFSIDAFFFLAPFICTSVRERRTLAKRIVFVIAIAGICFWQMPLTLEQARPTVEGWLGPIFAFLHGFDRPFNLAPSLHIALRTVLAETFARHAVGRWRWLSHLWFSLIGLSTLLVYQHHVVDVIGGFMLGVLALYLFREDTVEARVSPNPKVARLYATASMGCAALAFVWPWWSLWMLWPALSLALAAGSAWRWGPAIYRKVDGRIAPSARLVLGPLLVAQWLSLRHYARRSNAHDVLAHRLIIGRRLNDVEAARLVAHGIVAVVDLTAEFHASRPFHRLAYLNVQVADLTAPSMQQLDRAVAFVNQHRRHGVVYIHCKAGYSRTAAVAGAVLLSDDPTRSLDDVLSSLRAARRGMVIRPEIVRCLQHFSDRLQTANTNAGPRPSAFATPVTAEPAGST